METTKEEDMIEATTQEIPKTIHDNGHDNRVFADETGQTYLTRTAAHYQNGNGTSNGNYTNGQPPQTFRIIENSRL